MVKCSGSPNFTMGEVWCGCKLRSCSANRSDFDLTSLACRLRSERPGFESGFSPTAMSGMVRAVGLAQQRRNERCHGTTCAPTDGPTPKIERPQLRHCAWSQKCPEASHDQHLSVVTGGTSTNTPSSVGAWALKRNFPWRPTKGGVGIRRTKRAASACH